MLAATTPKFFGPYSFGETDDNPAAWSGQTGLLSLVLEAVAAVNWPRKQEAFVSEGERYRPDLLMAVLAYCYVTGVFGSADIEQSIHTDPVVGNLCGDSLPSWRTLRRFRKLHREPLKQCMAKVCYQALLIRFGETDEELPPPDYCVAVALDKWFEPLCVPSPNVEAEERLTRACFIDGMMLME